MKGIAVAGSALVDEINKIEKYPSIGQLTQVSQVERAVGGLVPNVGIDLKLLCHELNVYAYGKVGADDKAEFLLNTLKGAGIDCGNIKKSNSLGTSFTQVMSVVGGERTFFTYAGASSDFGYDDIDFDRLDVKLFHLGYFMLLEKVDNGDGLKILKQLKKQNIQTSIDLVSSTADCYEKVLPCLPYVDYLIINELEAAALCGVKESDNLLKLAACLKQKGVLKAVIIHKEDKACYFDGKYLEVSSLVVPKQLFKGKTGAGDAFCAGALLQIYKNATPEQILETGVRVAAASILDYGATGSVASVEQVFKLTENFQRR